MILNLSCCRFYADSHGDVTIKMVNAVAKYSFEYLGNAQKLVRTPLTDRCFLTLMQVGFFTKKKLILASIKFAILGHAFGNGRKSVRTGRNRKNRVR